jgi:hypothetical protein
VPLNINNGQNKIDRTKKMVLEYLGIWAQEDRERQVHTSENDGAFWLELLDQLPEEFRGKLQAYLKSDEAWSSAIKAFVAGNGSLDGATVRRGFHLRVEYPHNGLCRLPTLHSNLYNHFVIFWPREGKPNDAYQDQTD